MKRLLCIVGGMNAGGAETFLMKLYRNIDREKYQMDFCVSKKEKGFYDDEIIAMGGRIIHTVPKSKNPIASFKSIYNIVKDNELVSKKHLSLPEKLDNVIFCKNPRCITSVEQEIVHSFRLADPEKRIYRCVYCDTEHK